MSFEFFGGADPEIDSHIILLQCFGCYRGGNLGVPDRDLALGSTTAD